jgi:hypothetical protein
MAALAINPKLMGIFLSSTFQPLVGSLLAIADSPSVSLPLADQKGYLALATSFSDSLPWSVRPTPLLTDGSSLAVSGPGTAVIINTTTIQLLSFEGRVLTWSIRREVINALVAVIGPQAVVALGKNGILWINTRTGSWHHFNE